MDQKANMQNYSRGDVMAAFNSFSNIIDKNDGLRNFSIQDNSCYDSDVPFAAGTQTHLKITNNNHDINQLAETFITAKVKLTGHFGKTYSATTTDSSPTALKPNCLKFFIGLKNAAEIVRQLEVENNNVDTDYLQIDCVRESFAYHTYRSKSSKNIRKFSHSLYSNVHNYDNSVCGTYVDPTTFTAGTDKDIEFKIAFDVNDLLGLECFQDWPKFMGEIVLKMIMDKSAVVWCQVDPKKVSDLNTLIYETMNDDQNGLIQNSNPLYDHKFAQAGNKLKVIKTCAYTKAIAGDNSTSPVTLPVNSSIAFTLDTDTFTCTSLTVTELKCSSYGYKVNPSIMKELTTLFNPSKPFIIPAEFVDCKKFSQGSDGSSIDTDFSYALHNCTDAILAFPKDSNSCTCYENPMLKNLQLTIDGKLYPVKSIETVGERFFNMALTASNLDEHDEATEEYEDSLTRPLNADDGTRFSRTKNDQTSFIPPIQLERNGAGFFFDGIETFNENVKVRLTAVPMFAGANDTYYIPDSTAPTVHPPNPEVWFNRDVYWTADIQNGLKFHKTGTPPQYDNI